MVYQLRVSIQEDEVNGLLNRRANAPRGFESLLTSQLVLKEYNVTYLMCRVREEPYPDRTLGVSSYR